MTSQQIIIESRLFKTLSMIRLRWESSIRSSLTVKIAREVQRGYFELRLPERVIWTGAAIAAAIATHVTLAKAVLGQEIRTTTVTAGVLLIMCLMVVASCLRD